MELDSPVCVVGVNVASVASVASVANIDSVNAYAVDDGACRHGL